MNRLFGYSTVTMGSEQLYKVANAYTYVDL